MNLYFLFEVIYRFKLNKLVYSPLRVSKGVDTRQARRLSSCWEPVTSQIPIELYPLEIVTSHHYNFL